ncbi:MAG: helix-turn-helix domain-containing protein [Candidatus Nanoarchaeia archaeon]|nr:helix-turn-helix domain-containing protein [Candidatus Nanoarchaeia archaeon]
MWITKLKLYHNDCPIVNRCIKFNLIVLSYPSIWYERNGNKYATTICYFQCSDEKAKKAFIKDLRSDKRITKVEVSRDNFVYEINLGKKGEHVMLYYNHQIFFVKPTVNHFDGHEYWEIAAWNRKILEKFIKEEEKHMDGCEIMRLEQSDINEIRFPVLSPSLSKEQKKAVEIAYKNGYYNYPRKITIQKLAKFSGIAKSTFQEHLRKAELKLLPIIIEENIKQ